MLTNTLFLFFSVELFCSLPRCHPILCFFSFFFFVFQYFLSFCDNWFYFWYINGFFLTFIFATPRILKNLIFFDVVIILSCCIWYLYFKGSFGKALKKDCKLGLLNQPERGGFRKGFRCQNLLYRFIIALMNLNTLKHKIKKFIHC